MYTVYDLECEDEPESGLTLQEAGIRRLEKAGYRYEFRRVEGALALFLSEQRETAFSEAGPLVLAKVADAKDMSSAHVELLRWIISASFGGPYSVDTDEGYLRAMEKAGNEVDELRSSLAHGAFR